MRPEKQSHQAKAPIRYPAPTSSPGGALEAKGGTPTSRWPFQPSSPQWLPPHPPAYRVPIAAHSCPVCPRSQGPAPSPF